MVRSLPNSAEGEGPIPCLARSHILPSTKPVSHNCWAFILGPQAASAEPSPESLRSEARDVHSGKPVHRTEKQPLLITFRESLHEAMKNQKSHKEIKSKKKKKKKGSYNDVYYHWKKE